VARVALQTFRLIWSHSSTLALYRNIHTSSINIIGEFACNAILTQFAISEVANTVSDEGEGQTSVARGRGVQFVPVPASDADWGRGLVVNGTGGSVEVPVTSASICTLNETGQTCSALVGVGHVLFAEIDGLWGASVSNCFVVAQRTSLTGVVSVASPTVSLGSVKSVYIDFAMGNGVDLTTA
jgi:hypothetical protein